MNVSHDDIIMCRRASSASGSCVNVMRSHSSAICSADKDGSHASRPYAYQFACAKWWPHQLRSDPVLATAAMPVMREGCTPPWITFATVEPGPAAKVSL